MITSTYLDDSVYFIADYWTAPGRLGDSRASYLIVWFIIFDLFAPTTHSCVKGNMRFDCKMLMSTGSRISSPLVKAFLNRPTGGLGGDGE